MAMGIKSTALILAFMLLLMSAACRNGKPVERGDEPPAVTADVPSPESSTPPSATVPPSTLPSPVPPPDPTDPADPTPLSFDEAMAICNAWLDSHADLPSYAIFEMDYDDFDPTPPPTYGLFGEQYYAFLVSSHWDGASGYSHIILVPAETGALLSLFRTEPDGEPSATAVELLDDWYNGEHDTYAPALLTAEEAMAIYETWRERHFDSDDYHLSGHPYDRYVIFGQQYYWFQADMYWYNILVHMETGAMLHMMISDGLYGGTDIERLDDWYGAP